MDDMTLEVKIGSVESGIGKLSFTLVIRNSRNGYLRIYASDPSDLRKSGVMLSLDASEYAELKELLDRTDRTIDDMRRSGQMDLMKVQY